MEQGPESLESFRKAFEVLDALTRDDPDSAPAQCSLAITLSNIGTQEVRRGRHAEALAHYQRAVVCLKTAIDREPYRASYRSHLEQFSRSVCLLAIGLRKPDVAFRALSDWSRLVEGRPEDQYMAARGFALCIPLSPDAAMQARCADRAMAALRLAVAAGWHDWDAAAREPDLRALHDRREFRAFLADHRAPSDPVRPPTRPPDPTSATTEPEPPSTSGQTSRDR